MSDLKPCPFCGSEVNFWTRKAPEVEEYQALIIDCKVCPANMEEWVYKYDKNFTDNFEKKKAEMFKAWNRRIERTAKVLNITHVRGYPPEGECSNCGFDVVDDGEYCPGCGARLEWKADEQV